MPVGLLKAELQAICPGFKLSPPLTDEKVEAELIGFEKLLYGVLAFKSNSSTWSRNDRLSYTQNFAEAFDNLIGDGSSDEESTTKTKPD